MDLPEHLKEHPLFTKKGAIAIISGENPRFRPSIHGGHDALKTELQLLNLKHQETHGKYDAPERSMMVYNPTKEQALDLGRKFGQESIIYSENGHHQLIYSNGPNYGMHHDTTEPHINYFDSPPDNYYTQLPEGGFFNLNFDFSHLRDHEHTMEIKKSEPEIIKKYIHDVPIAYRNISHPHSYPWVWDDQMQHNSSEYAKYSIPFGNINAGIKTDLLHYPYWNKLAEVEHLASQHGYRINEWKDKPKYPDRNYNTGDLWVYPSKSLDLQDKQYDRTYKILHELSHALTDKNADKIYNKNNMMSKSLKNVYREYLAGMKQRELSKQIGVHIDNNNFSKEMNILMSDAIHRSLSNKYVDPSDLGFMPHSRLIPLNTALSLVAEHTFKRGLR